MNIQQQIQQELHKSSQSNRFNVSNTQRHIHNNIDSPYAFQPVLTYGGSLTSAGIVQFLPISFTVNKAGQGVYVVTHNLNTLLYTTVPVAMGTLGVACGIVQNLNTVEFTWVNTINLITTDTAFNFELTVFNNKSQILPKYVGTLLT